MKEKEGRERERVKERQSQKEKNKGIMYTNVKMILLKLMRLIVGVFFVSTSGLKFLIKCCCLFVLLYVDYTSIELIHKRV